MAEIAALRELEERAPNVGKLVSLGWLDYSTGEDLTLLMRRERELRWRALTGAIRAEAAAVHL